MVQSNKILTVSYGTFSCTLEGFEESFDTMKAIAEYFRDLAADDRYFGAEPPTPDAEMLARIAEREIARRVEAHLDEEGILLRAAPVAGAAVAGATALAGTGGGASQPLQTSQESAPATVAPSAVPVAEDVDKTPETSGKTAQLEEDVSDAADFEEPQEQAHVDQKAADEFPEIEEDPQAMTELSAEAFDADDLAENIDAEAFEDIEHEAIADIDAEEIDDPVTDVAATVQSTMDGAKLIDAEIAEDETSEEVAAAPTPLRGPKRADSFDENSVAAKLARIRAVVSGDQAPASEYIEDEHANTAPFSAGYDVEDANTAAIEDEIEADVASDVTPVGDAVAAAMAGTGGVPSGDASEKEILADTAAPQNSAHQDIEVQEPEVEAKSDAELLAGVGPTVEEVVEATRAPSAEEPVEEPVAEERKAPQVRVVRVKRNKKHNKKKIAKKAAEAVADVAPAAAPLVLDAQTRVEEAEESVLSAEDEDDLMRELAAVEAEFSDEMPNEMSDDALVEDDDDALAEWDADEAHDDESYDDADDLTAADVAAEEAFDEIDEDALDLADDVAHEAPSETPAEPDAAQLERRSTELDVAEFLARTQGTATQDDTAEETAPRIEEDLDNTPEPDPSVSRSIRALTRRVRMAESSDKGGERDVSRLMAETEAQLDEPEGRNRRSAIAHLRAAVAATREERQSAAAPAASDDREAQFREDLNAVRPRASEAEAKRAAPLKLVAEQRVDVEDSVEKSVSEAERRAAPAINTVRPRRISARRPAEQAPSREAATVSDGGFMTYVEDSGARGLPELLEAAAAYMTLVEKRPQFSRPQLMSKVREVNDEDFSREDRLRYFGQLLREGKIEKTASGRFTASEQIGFQPDERAAG